MDFALLVALSFIVGGGYISLIVWVAEKLGTRIGGAIAGTPTTLLVGLGFISLSDGAAAARAATTIVPVMLGAALVYVFFFVRACESLTSRYKHALSGLVALVLWGGVALVLRKMFANVSFELTLLSGSIGVIACAVLFRGFPTIKPKKLAARKNVYMFRFIVAGSAIASSVVLARVLGPTWGGLAASSPVTFATSLYFLNKSQSCDFTKGFAKRLPPAIVSIFIFTVILYVTLTTLPVVLCFVIAMAGALLYTYILATWRASYHKHG